MVRQHPVGPWPPTPARVPNFLVKEMGPERFRAFLQKVQDAAEEAVGVPLIWQELEQAGVLELMPANITPDGVLYARTPGDLGALGNPT